MTTVLAGADIYGFYQALGIQLPRWAHTEATVRCFAQPDLHQRDDHDPSMSINLRHGAYHCHGCGARGGAYDAALEKGHPPRDAIELMIDHGLIHRRALAPHSPARSRPTARPAGCAAREIRRGPLPSRSRLADKETELARAHRRLMARPETVRQLVEQRGWTPTTLDALQLGLDEHHRITIPVRTTTAELVAVLRYRPDGAPPKLLADRGSRRVLYPQPAALDSQTILLVEGEPDRIAAHSHGLPAIAIPGADAWQPSWAPLLHDRRIVLALDADTAGRACAQRVEADLARHATWVHTVDLGPERDDGYDLTDWLRDHRGNGQNLLDTLTACSVPRQ